MKTWPMRLVFIWLKKDAIPRDYNLIAFGGAGPVHAYRVAERLKFKTLVCPLAAGVTSAFGHADGTISV